MKSTISLQRRVLLTSLLDHRQPLGYQGRILGRLSRVGNLSSSGKIILALRGRLGN